MKQGKRRTAFILAAGLGTRLKELTQNKPKALVELNKRPLLEIVIDNLIKQNFNHFVINIHHLGEQIIDFIDKRKFNDIEIEISDERDMLYDTGGGVIKALPYFKESEAVLIHNVDIITDIDLQSIYNDFIQCDDAVWLLTQKRDNKRKLVFDSHDNFAGRYNIDTSEFDGDGEIKDDFKLLSFSGLHLIKPNHLSSFPLCKCYIFDIYREIAKGNRVKSKFIQPTYWFDLGTQQHLKEATLWLLSQE